MRPSSSTAPAPLSPSAADELRYLQGWARSGMIDEASLQSLSASLEQLSSRNLLDDAFATCFQECVATSFHGLERTAHLFQDVEHDRAELSALENNRSLLAQKIQLGQDLEVRLAAKQEEIGALEQQLAAKRRECDLLVAERSQHLSDAQALKSSISGQEARSNRFGYKEWKLWQAQQQNEVNRLFLTSLIDQIKL